MSGAVIISGARTPIGKLLGSLGSFSAPQLASIAITEALRRANISAESVDYAIIGQVLQAGSGQAPARQATVGAGIPMTVPSITINKVCLSGMHAIYLADQMIAAGDAEIVVAGGMESMTNAPYLLPGARKGYKYGPKEVIDSMDFDGLFCALEHRAMGASTDAYNKRDAQFSREEQDEFAYESHMRAAKATDNGVIAEEIVSQSLTLTEDEGIRRDTSLDALGKLKPAFGNGTVTAGNASQLSDGAAALIITSREKAESLGVEPLCEVAGYGMVAGPDPSLLTQPSRAIKQAAEKAKLQISDIDVFEINEAFASVALAATRDLGISRDVLNVNGGAIALGHPIGMSGTRLALTLAFEMKRRGANFGAAGLCGGGGQGDAIVLKSI
jgi:acetyl-CoA C-acetyltransferase